MYNIETLGKLTGLTRRTIRYYIQKGLLEPPEGGGRGAFYTEKHVEQLKKIKTLSEQGVLLIRMKDVMDGKQPSQESGEMAGLMINRRETCHLAPGIELAYEPGMFSLEDLGEIRDHVSQILRRKQA
jgi:DNA-binding transcriptional MerR regulator